MPAMSLRVVARIKARAETVSEVSELLSSLVEPTRKEFGCITYELLQNTKDATDFTFVEEWESDEALASHLASDHLEAIGPKLKPLVTDLPDIGTYWLVR